MNLVEVSLLLWQLEFKLNCRLEVDLHSSHCHIVRSNERDSLGVALEPVDLGVETMSTVLCVEHSVQVLECELEGLETGSVMINAKDGSRTLSR